MSAVPAPGLAGFRHLIHDLNNDIGALRLRLVVLAHADAPDAGQHVVAATRLAAHAEELLREMREHLDREEGAVDPPRRPRAGRG